MTDRWIGRVLSRKTVRARTHAIAAKMAAWPRRSTSGLHRFPYHRGQRTGEPSCTRLA